MGTLDGRRALVTGGSRGIGAAVAVALAEAGADVALTYHHRRDDAEAVVKQIEAAGRRGLALAADAMDAAAVQEAVAVAVATLGGLDILVNNAGIAVKGQLTTIALADIDASIATNVRGPIVTAQAAARLITDGGRMIHVGSCLTTRSAGPGMSLYIATKSAVIGLSKGLARDLAPRGITSNVVQPGPVDTDMNPSDSPSSDRQRSYLALDRYGTAEEVATAVCFLAGPDAAFITGTELVVAGGHTA